MMLGDVASEHVQFWWITLGLGAVVISAVILLLGFLTVLVKDIQAGVDAIWEEAKGVAAQTASTWMLNDTLRLAEGLGGEVALHAEVLGAAAAGKS